MDKENKQYKPDNTNTRSRNKGPTAKILRFLLSMFLLAAILFAGLLEYLTLTEYRPQEREHVAVSPWPGDPIYPGVSLKVMTWNCGYGALGDNADFFMDGGKRVMTADRERVRSNLAGIEQTTAQLQPDVCFLQEVDRDSTRSFHIDELIGINNTLMEDYELDYIPAFAYNYDVEFVPFPIPPIGKVRSGIMTLTDISIESAERIQLPCPFRWPVRLGNLKRCLLITRTPVRETDKELVLINLHLEAFDDGDGKIAQTKALRDILNEEAAKGNYVIAGGDFNQAFNNTDISAYPQQEGKWQPGTIDTEEFGDAWQCLMDSRVPTCRSLDQPYEGADHDTFQYYVIDGFIVSSNINVKSCETQDMGFVRTDHNPVLMECVLK